MSRKSSEKRHELTADAHQRRLVAMVRESSHAHRVHTVFSDFVEMCAISISNSVDRSQFDAREKRYLEIVGKYRREEVERFTRMFAVLVMSFETRAVISGGGLTDVLGETYMMLEISNDRTGQFFTPYSVSRMMSAMLMGDGGDEVRKHGFVRLQEPACGAGGMVIAAADALISAGANYQQAMHATCVDIDPCCVHMAYMQLSLLHIPAMVVHGDSLSLDVWALWYTPAHIMGGWRWKLKFRDMQTVLASGREEPESFEPKRGEPSEAAPDATVCAPFVVDDVEEGDVVVLDPPVDSQVLDRSEAVDCAPSFIDMMDAVFDAPQEPATVFERIGQLALF